MDPITGAIAAAPFFLEWAKERRQARQDLDLAAFREWLTEVAFPRVLEASQTTFELLSVGQKAHHAELLGYLDTQFGDIKAKLEAARVGGSVAATFADRWKKLGPAAQTLLMSLGEQVAADAWSYEEAQLTGPFLIPNLTPGEIDSGLELAAEARLVRYQKASNNCQSLRLTAAGYLVTRAASDRQDAFDGDIESLRCALAKAPDGPLDKVVAYTFDRCTKAFVYAALEQWESAGWIVFQPVWPRENSRLMRPAQALLRGEIEDLRRKALRPFLD